MLSIEAQTVAAAEHSRSEVIEQNIGLVHACANRFRGRGLEYDDLFQAGCVGLIKAADAFDYDRGVRFSTYAVPVILGEIKRLFRDGGSVKVSRSLKELAIKAGRVREEILRDQGREPAVSEIAQALGVDDQTAAQAIGAALPPISLTESDEEGGGQMDVAVQSCEEQLSEQLSLQALIRSLPERDQQLIRLRYFCSKTQVETAKELGMTQVQVSRREKKLLLLMRQQLLE